MKKLTLDSTQARQGDVLLQWLDDRSSIAAARAIEQRALLPIPTDKDGSTTLAHGEVTGHRHRFVCHSDGGSDAITYGHPLAPTEPTLVHVLEPTALRHEEHGFIDSPRGLARISRPYEYFGPELLKRVED